MSVLEVQDASFAYGRREVFHGVSFSLRQGQVLSVIGPNGSGKSTLLNCLAGLLRPRAGDLSPSLRSCISTSHLLHIL